MRRLTPAPRAWSLKLLTRSPTAPSTYARPPCHPYTRSSPRDPCTTGPVAGVASSPRPRSTNANGPKTRSPSLPSKDTPCPCAASSPPRAGRHRPTSRGPLFVKTWSRSPSGVEISTAGQHHSREPSSGFRCSCCRCCCCGCCRRGCCPGCFCCCSGGDDVGGACCFCCGGCRLGGRPVARAVTS